MRPLLPASFAALALAILTLPIGCAPEECEKSCDSTIVINAHVLGGSAALEGAQITFCRNSVCASTTRGAGPLTGASFSAQATVAPEIDGFTVVGLTMDVSGLQPADGDTYSVTIVGAAGQQLLSVTRPINYEISHGCTTTCRSYSTDVYPQSASGIACGSGMCESGISTSGAFDSTDLDHLVEISLCRNDTCGKASISLPVGFSDGLSTSLSGAMVGTLDIQETARDSRSFEFQIIVQDDAAALRDGDTYTLTAKQDGKTLTTWTGVAPYKTLAEIWPDGPNKKSIGSSQCDPYGCRFASFNTPPLPP